MCCKKCAFMTIHFNIHSASTTNTSTPTQLLAASVKKKPEPNQVKDTKEKQVSDESVSIAAFTGDAPSSSPYSALLNPEGFDYIRLRTIYPNFGLTNYKLT